MNLEPCPFCGGPAEIERPGTSRQFCIVVCTDCGCRLESSDEDDRSGESWNDRAETPYAGLVRAAMRDLPKGWVIITEVERGGWSVCLANPKGRAEPFDLIHDDVEGQFGDAFMRAVEPKP